MTLKEVVLILANILFAVVEYTIADREAQLKMKEDLVKVIVEMKKWGKEVTHP